MHPLEFTIRDGHPIDGPGWVYVWLLDGRVLYVGATWVHPAARAELHLSNENADPRSVAIRKRLAAPGGTPPTIIGLPVSADADRQALKHALIAACRDRGWLSQEFVEPGSNHDGAQSQDWLNEALSALEPLVRA
ncbi:hypothetical protein [Nocardioides sp.]|uniref:hypothetical protein n=1 Tax=Nocardioides sp. TaxID=35761 RepID=UPI0027370D0F|nr:hypothetical protein [Nocardioides sp.]MDP3891249.1 hypothetical protein [Nocardioides sp.]